MFLCNKTKLSMTKADYNLVWMDSHYGTPSFPVEKTLIVSKTEPILNPNLTNTMPKPNFKDAVP